MPNINLIFTDEEINKIADRIAIRLSNHKKNLSYGIIARYEKSTVCFECNENSNDEFIIRDNDGNVIGKFVEVDTTKHGE